MKQYEIPHPHENGYFSELIRRKLGLEVMVLVNPVNGKLILRTWEDELTPDQIEAIKRVLEVKE